MKYYIKIIFAVLAVILATGCSKEDVQPQVRPGSFQFAYTLKDTTVTQGDSITVAVEALNCSEDHPYTGSPEDLFGPAKLCPNANESSALVTLPFVKTSDATERIFKSGEVVKRTYTFSTDKYSDIGTYDLFLSFAGTTVSFEDILSVEIPMTEEEKELVSIANAEILREYPIDSLEHYTVSIYHYDNGVSRVRYDLKIGGYDSNESYWVDFYVDKRVKKIDGDYGEYAVYLPYASTEAVRTAEEKLSDKISVYGNKSPYYYLTIDEKGYLCLTVEVIVPIAPPKEGGIDHDHLYFSERICGIQ